MVTHIPSINNLRAFEAAGRLGGFNLAADELNISQPTVSYRVAKLEDDLGVLLFRRLTRKIVLTKDGEKFLPVVTASLKMLQDGVDTLGRGAKRSLTVTLSSYLAARWLLPLLPHWSARNPNTAIHLDHDTGKNAEHSDVVIYWSKHAVEQQKTQLLFPTDVSVHCSPDIAADLKTPGDVLKYPLLKLVPHLDPWTEWFELAGIKETAATTSLRMADSNVRIKAAVDGLGIALANQFAKPERDAGLLVEPFDIVLKGPGFYCRNQSSAPELADRFISWLKRMAADAD